MVVGVCRLTLVASHCRSLKDKRNVVRRIKARAKNQFHLPISEVGSLDNWQRIELGFAVVSGDRAYVEQQTTNVVSFIVDMGEARLMDEERDILRYGAAMVGGAASEAVTEPDDWAPPEWRDEGDGDAGSDDGAPGGAGQVSDG